MVRSDMRGPFYRKTTASWDHRVGGTSSPRRDESVRRDPIASRPQSTRSPRVFTPLGGRRPRVALVLWPRATKPGGIMASPPSDAAPDPAGGQGRRPHVLLL